MMESKSKNRIKAVLLSAMVFLLFSCATSRQADYGYIKGIDELVSTIADETIPILPKGKQVTLAVYYFTADGKPSVISDYLINGVTTEIANRGGDNLTMVSRQGLDRIMEEHSFMLTDLVSEDTQVSLGQLLGADLILTGYITPLKDYSKINIQLINVETGAVIGGFQLNYRLEKEFRQDSVDTVISPDNALPKIKGVTTTTTILDDFDGPVTHMNFFHYEESWGDLFTGKKASVSANNGAAVLDFSADLDSDNLINLWNDSDLNFYAGFKTNYSPGDYDGFSVDLNPEGFSQVYLFATQQFPDGDRVFGVPVTLNPGKWNHLQIPFSVLKDYSYTGSLEEDNPLILSFGVPFGANYELFHFRTPGRLSGKLLVDNIGLFTYDDTEEGRVLASFDDEVSRAVPFVNITNASLFVDYSNSDEGVLKQNDGIQDTTLSVSRVPEGPAGTFLEVKGSLNLDGRIEPFLEKDQPVVVNLVLNTGKSLAGRHRLSFIVRSGFASSGYIQIAEPSSGLAYGTSFFIHSGWGQIDIPFSDLVSDEGSMEDNPPLSDKIQITMSFPIVPEAIREAVSTGKFDFDVSVDQILLGD